MGESARLQKNISVYVWYRACSSFLPWLPIFFLYFNQFVPLQGVLTLSAIYYLGVVVLEVPSGYFSDRVGRKRTLLIAAIFAVLASVFFIFAQTFQWFIVAQLLLAGSIAFQSGSDSSLLYESLEALNRESEFVEIEAKGQRAGLVGLAVSALFGGIIGSYSFTLVYGVSIVASLLTVYIASQFSAPVSTHPKSTNSFVQQIIVCLVQMRTPVLLWLSFYYVLMYGLSHIPYEFVQPYILLLSKTTNLSDLTQQLFASKDGNSAPLVSGLTLAISMFGGVVGAWASVSLFRKFGLKSLLLGCAFFECLIVAVMALLLSAWALPLIMSRNTAMAIMHAPRLSVINALVSNEFRATYLSLQSLLARLMLSGLMYLLATQAAPLAPDASGTLQQSISWETLSGVLQLALAVGIAGIGLLTLTSVFLKHNKLSNE